MIGVNLGAFVQGHEAGMDRNNKQEFMKQRKQQFQQQTQMNNQAIEGQQNQLDLQNLITSEANKIADQREGKQAMNRAWTDYEAIITDAQDNSSVRVVDMFNETIKANPALTKLANGKFMTAVNPNDTAKMDKWAQDNGIDTTQLSFDEQRELYSTLSDSGIFVVNGDGDISDLENVKMAFGLKADQAIVDSKQYEAMYSDSLAKLRGLAQTANNKKEFQSEKLTLQDNIKWYEQKYPTFASLTSTEGMTDSIKADYDDYKRQQSTLSYLTTKAQNGAGSTDYERISKRFAEDKYTNPTEKEYDKKWLDNYFKDKTKEPISITGQKYGSNVLTNAQNYTGTDLNEAQKLENDVVSGKNAPSYIKTRKEIKAKHDSTKEVLKLADNVTKALKTGKIDSGAWDTLYQTAKQYISNDTLDILQLTKSQDFTRLNAEVQGLARQFARSVEKGVLTDADAKYYTSILVGDPFMQEPERVTQMAVLRANQVSSYNDLLDAEARDLPHTRLTYPKFETPETKASRNTPNKYSDILKGE